MKALLTDNLPLLAGAPNGIKKLRELILELAVHGKLVPQKTEELSAKPGLDASRMTRSKAMAAGKIKKEKPAAEVIENEQPFSLPSGWVWCRIVDTGDYINGVAFKPSDWSSMGRPIIRIQNLSGRNAEFNRTEREVDSSVVVSSGDILVSWSATLDVFIWQGEQAVLNQHIFRVVPSAVMHDQYLYWLLKWAIKVLADSDHAHGLVMAHINRGPFLAQPVGLPPLAEQHRIVAKVDELMALCDRLEAQQADAESAHAQLVQALLDSLTQASDATDFAANWQRLTEYFHTLFTTEPSIDALKQTLLQLAVMGKLVSQDANDEPVCELLKRMADGKVELVRSGLSKAPKPLPEIKQEEIPYQLPQTWQWVRLGDISEFANGDRGKNYPNRSEYVSEGIPWINTGHIDPDGSLDQSGMHFITREKFDSLNGGKIRLGDLVYCLRGATFGKTAIVDPYSEGAIASSLMIIRPFEPCSNRYMYRYLTSKIGKDQIFRFDNGSAQPNLSANSVRLYVYPLPPLAEQHRIVAKVDQLMALCDQLKTRLTQARQLNQQLASTLVEQAVA